MDSWAIYPINISDKSLFNYLLYHKISLPRRMLADHFIGKTKS